MSSDEELGACLRDARTARQQKIADLARETGLPERYLEALEAGRFGELPDKAYARIYYANYARVLGLDTEDLMLRWPEPAALAAPPTESRRRKFPWWSLSAAALALILAWVVLEWVRGRGESTAEGPDDMMATVPTDATRTVSSAVADSTPAEPVAHTLASAVSAEAAPPLPPVAAEVHELVVHATGQTWIRVDADGETMFDTVLGRGDSLTVAGRDEFHLWATIPRWVRVWLDGDRIGLPQDAGESLIRHRIPAAKGGKR